jgi:hypothetical protein
VPSIPVQSNSSLLYPFGNGTGDNRFDTPIIFNGDCASGLVVLTSNSAFPFGDALQRTIYVSIRILLGTNMFECTSVLFLKLL